MVVGSGLFSGLKFAPIIPDLLKVPYLVRDFTRGCDALPELSDTGFKYDVGRYNERRLSMYTSDLFGAADPWAKKGEVRNIHMGIDIGGPVGTEVHSITDCTVHSCGYNPAHLDYGHVVVTEQVLNGLRVWALYGHLSASSITAKKTGQRIAMGDVIGSIGDIHENGGWP